MRGTNFWVMVLVVFVVGASAVRGDTITADNVHGVPGSTFVSLPIGNASSVPPVVVNSAAGQEFAASVSGVVTTLEAAVVRDAAAGTATLTVGIYTKSGGSVGSLLGQASFGPSGVGLLSAGLFNTFDLSGAGITLAAGQSYFVTFTTDIPLSGGRRYLASPVGNAAYAFGAAPIVSPDAGGSWSSFGFPSEIGLTLRVADAAGTAVPLPGAAGMGGVLVVGMAGVRRRARGG